MPERRGTGPGFDETTEWATEKKNALARSTPRGVTARSRIASSADERRRVIALLGAFVGSVPPVDDLVARPDMTTLVVL